MIRAICRAILKCLTFSIRRGQINRFTTELQAVRDDRDRLIRFLIETHDQDPILYQKVHRILDFVHNRIASIRPPLHDAPQTPLTESRRAQLVSEIDALNLKYCLEGRPE